MGSQNQYTGTTEKDYDYIKYYEKAQKHSSGEQLEKILEIKRVHESIRDYNMISLRLVFKYNLEPSEANINLKPFLRQINHLIQIDEKPNIELKEPRWEIYKISISFNFESKNNFLYYFR